MNQQFEYFKLAELALAAYANFNSDISAKAELKDADFSTNQARAFAETSLVVVQHTDVTAIYR